MELDDGEILPAPLPRPWVTDGSIPAGTIAGQQVASGPVASSRAARQFAAQVNAIFGIPPALAAPPPPQQPPPQQPPPQQPPPPGRRAVQPSRRTPGSASYARGLAGFDGQGIIPGEDPPELAGEIPDVYGVVRGYRWWTLDAPPLHLSPASAGESWKQAPLRGMQAAWEAGENRAECRAGTKYHEDSEIPDENCGCGFWAYWELQRHDVGTHALPVCGVIEGYGAVLIGEKGFRAAKARIVALHLPFTIMPATETEGDPLGLGLPPYHPRTPSGQRNPWWNHPQFPGKVHSYPGRGGHDDVDDDLASLARPQPAVPELSGPSAEERQAARDAAEAWMAVIGDRLEQMYPGVRICETRALMEKMYPPDYSYVPERSGCECHRVDPLAYIGPSGHKRGCPLF